MVWDHDEWERHCMGTLHNRHNNGMGAQQNVFHHGIETRQNYTVTEWEWEYDIMGYGGSQSLRCPPLLFQHTHSKPSHHQPMDREENVMMCN